MIYKVVGIMNDGKTKTLFNVRGEKIDHVWAHVFVHRDAVEPGSWQVSVAETGYGLLDFGLPNRMAAINAAYAKLKLIGKDNYDAHVRASGGELVSLGLIGVNRWT